MWKRLVVIVLSLSVALSPTVVLAAGSADVGVIARPAATGGILDFTVTYITETDMRLDWTLFGDATNIMIRAKYGSYPANIPNINTAPSDGYLVYSGNGTTTHDTSMNFDENPGGLYYAAWAQKADGTWFMDLKTGWKESQVMTLLALLAFAGILTFVGVRSSYYLLKIIAGFAWLLPMAYWISTPPSAITKGDSVHSIGIIMFIGVAIALWFMPLWYTKNNNGVEEGRFNLRMPRIFGGQTEQEEAEQLQRNARTWRERRDAYRERMDRATGRGR